MSRRLLIVLGALAVVSLLTPSLAGARRKPRFPACPGGVFVVIGDPLIPGGAPAVEDRLRLGGGQIAFSSGCPSTSKASAAAERTGGATTTCRLGSVA